MPVGIGASGIMGIAFEPTRNQYTAPTKFFPFRSESLRLNPNIVWRRVIRGVVDPLGAIAGNAAVEGDIEIEALPDVVAWFMYAARTTVTKTGAGPYTYAAIGNTAAEGTSGRSLSITIVRNGAVFGYTGCQVGSFRFTIQDGALVLNMSIFGSDEATQAVPVATYSNQEPFGAGQYNFQIPTTTQVFDIDTFTFEVDDSAEHQFRHKTTRGAQYIKFGERNAHVQVERDFFDKTEYEAFKARTALSLTFLATQGANAQVEMLIPVSIKNSYELGLSSQGDLVRGSIDYIGTYHSSTGSAYKVTTVTTENIT